MLFPNRIAGRGSFEISEFRLTFNPVASNPIFLAACTTPNIVVPPALVPAAILKFATLASMLQYLATNASATGPQSAGP